MQLASVEIALIIVFIVTAMTFYLATMFNYYTFYSKKTIDGNFDSEEGGKNNSGSKIMELDDENDLGTAERAKEAEANFDPINADGEQINSHRETDTGRNFIASKGVKARTVLNDERSKNTGIRNF